MSRFGEIQSAFFRKRSVCVELSSWVFDAENQRIFLNGIGIENELPNWIADCIEGRIIFAIAKPLEEDAKPSSVEGVVVGTPAFQFGEFFNHRVGAMAQKSEPNMA